MNQILAYDSNDNVVSKELSNFDSFDMSIIQEDNQYLLKLNSKYTYYGNFATKEDAVAKMAEITDSINKYIDSE